MDGRPNFDPGGQGTVQTGRGTPHAQHQPSRQDGGEDRGPRRVRGSISEIIKKIEANKLLMRSNELICNLVSINDTGFSA